MEKRETLCCWVSPATELTGQSQAFRNLGDGSQGQGVCRHRPSALPLQCVLLKVYRLIDHLVVI